MTDDRSAFTDARDAGKAIHQAQRLENATYTAVEVKALTKTAADLAYALGRKETAEEIAQALLDFEANDIRGRADMSIDRAAAIAREIGKGGPT